MLERERERMEGRESKVGEERENIGERMRDGWWWENGEWETLGFDQSILHFYFFFFIKNSDLFF